LNPIIGISVSEYRGTDRFDDPVFYVLIHCSDVDVINSIVLYVYMRCQCDRIKTFGSVPKVTPLNLHRR
jgi:hypothetical protein